MADASVRLEKNQNKKNIKIFEKSKSNAVGVGVLDDPLVEQKHINKITSNIPTSNIKNPTSNAAITLIALIITIIVLLILAGVTLSMVMGESGIFSKANNAKNKTEVSQYEEELRMCILELQTDTATNKETFGMKTIKNKLVEKVKELENTEDIEFPTEESETRLDGTYKGYEFYVDDKYAAHIGDKATGIQLTTSLNPSGWTKQNVTATITIKSNNGINKVEPDEGTKNGSNEYVITKTNITENTSFKYTVTDGQGNTQTKTAIVNTIDKESPADFTITAENTENGLQINNATTIDSGSGIEKYEYYAKKSTDGDYTKYESNPITGLASGTYSVYVIAYDKAGNTKQSNTVETKISKTYSNITAQMVAEHPEIYYGLKVTNYTSVNGQNDWKIFHSDGTNIYLITGNYVKVTDDNGNIDTNKLNTDTKMQIASGGKNYGVSWNSSNLPTFSKDVSSDTISKFKINTSVFEINNHKSNSNAKCASTLLNENNWSSYKDSENKAEIAIGGPTVQLWMNSWNARYPGQEVYCDSSNDKGYYIRTSTGTATTRNIVLNSNKGNGGELYFANNHSTLIDGNNTVQFYWLASPAAGFSDEVVCIHCENEIFKFSYNVGKHYIDGAWVTSSYIYGGLRPVVCLGSEITVDAEDAE